MGRQVSRRNSLVELPELDLPDDAVVSDVESDNDDDWEVGCVQDLSMHDSSVQGPPAHGPIQ